MDCNLYLYDAHVELISLTRQVGDIHEARKARNSMAEIFPLSESQLNCFFYIHVYTHTVVNCVTDINMHVVQNIIVYAICTCTCVHH